MILSASYAAHAKSIDLRQSNNENNPSPGRSRWVGQIKKQLLLGMKLTAVLLLVACMQVSARGFGQGTITISLRDVLVTEVFKEIEKQTSFRFLYRDELVKKAGVISVEMKDATVEAVLNRCFDKKPLEYKIFKETIVISEKGANVSNGGGTGMMEAPLPLINVTGRVLNEQGKPVEGVTVTIKGTDKSTSTNTNGEFFLSSVERDAVLVFTSVNMEQFELKVSGKTELVVNLKAKVSELGGVEVVVNTGYQQVPKERATGSFVFIPKEELNRRIAIDVLSKLEGITNGLVFNKKPSTGENQLRIRGESTIFANAGPLIVVDNFPYDGDINSINPNDVESITVLKDAAAASIWGVQAGNGVIVITTRRGKANQPLRIELNANITSSEKPNLFHAPQISPSDYIDFETFLFGQGHYDPILNDVDKVAVSPVVEILNKRKLGLISSNDSATQINALRKIDLRNQLGEYLFRKSIQQQYQLSLSGGSNMVTYYFSAGYDRNLLDIIGNKNERITLNTFTTFKPIRGLEISSGLYYINGIKNNNGNSSISNAFPYMRLVDEMGHQLPIPQRRVDFEDTIGNYGFPDWKYYPLQERNNATNTINSSEARLLTKAKYTLINGLSAELTYQYHRTLSREDALLNRNSYFIRNNTNRFAIVNSSGQFTGSNYPSGGLLDFRTSELVAHYGRLNLNFNRSWNSNSIAAIAGIDIREIRTTNNGFRYYGYDDATGTFIVPNLFSEYMTFPSGVPSTIDNPTGTISYSGTINRFRSYFSNIAYTYNSRYTISTSVRFDGSNYFGVNTNKKTVPLWSAGFKWDIGNEKFYKIKNLPYLALRVTFGYNGNLAQNIAAITTIKYNGNAQYSGLPYAIVNNIPNSELRWEKTAHMNIGVDFTSINDRISGSIEYFHKNGKDMIGDAPIDPTTGVTQIRGNFSGIKSNGIDAQIRTINLKGSFAWTTIFNVNFAAEKVTKYDVSYAAQTYLNAYSLLTPRVGDPLYSLYSYRWGGLDPNSGDPRIILGDTLNNTYNGANTALIKIGDLIYNGRYNPPITGFIMNNFSFKGISIGFNITYKLNYSFRRSSIVYNSLISNGWRFGHMDYSNRWLKPGDEARTNIPSLNYPTNSIRDQFYSNSDILVEKGDHVRLQYINVSYDFRHVTLKKVSLNNLQIYFYANNLGILWRANDKGIDPDYPYLQYPPSRTYSIGLKANL